MCKLPLITGFDDFLNTPEGKQFLQELNDIVDVMDDAKIIFKIAEFIHNEWMEWAKSVYAEVSVERQQRWDKCMVPYNELPSDEQYKNVKWAIKLWKFIQDGE